MKQTLILASNSPRRKELLLNLGVNIKIITSDVEEIVEGTPPPQLLVQELALLKGADVAKKLNSGIVISADTVVYLDDEILCKPKNKADAKAMLMKLSGNTHLVYTGICVIDANSAKSITDFEVTEVDFRNLSEEEIDRYIMTGEPMDKAGAYGIQEKGSLLVKKINGDYFNVVGLPLSKLNDILKDEFDIKLL